MTNHEQERLQKYAHAIYSTAADASAVEDVIDLADAEVTAMARKAARRIVEARRDIDLLNSLYHATAAKNMRLANEVERLRSARDEANSRTLRMWERATEAETDAQNTRIERDDLRDTLRAVQKVVDGQRAPIVAAWIVGQREGEERLTSVSVIRLHDIVNALEGAQ